MASTSSLLFIIIIIVVVVVIVFPVSTTAQQQSSNRNITPGSSIVANADATRTWTSPSGEFAFGFRQVAPGAFLLAVWFDQLPEKTLVWSANRDAPVPAGSTVQLSTDGTLVLIHLINGGIWRAPSQPGRAAYAAMLDTGNFVLAINTSAILWGSFDEPTDTLLPTQSLNRDDVLVSGFSETNYSTGKFRLTLLSDGNLVLITAAFSSADAYWSSESQTLETGVRLMFNDSGSINFVRMNGSLLRPLFNNTDLVGEFHQRLTLEHDGVLRRYVYPKSANSSTAPTWTARGFVPSNICRAVREAHTGGGACGFNGVCKMEADGRPSCGCPPGYSSRGGLAGCAPTFAPHRCDQQSQDAQDFVFEDIYNTDWPLVDYANVFNVGEEWCRQSCLNDCFCDVAVYNIRNCYKKSLPFSNGREDSGFGGKAMIKLRRNHTTISNPNSSTSACKNLNLIITLSVLLGSSLLLLLLLASSVLFLKHRKSAVVCQAAGVNMIPSFSFKELQEATDEFKDELGRGACSIVYRGALRDGRVVAVKKLNTMAKEANVEFIAEVSSISKTNHKNLVRLLGFCDQGQHRILVYEFMTNGSLATFLFQKSPSPNWYTRLQIAFAIARGLCYLHEDCSAPIIHCDIKPQNVLLDESFTPKIADFGLAKLMRPDQTRTITGIRGTRGYVAPEWFRNMAITVKVDVYSFGILLLELLCCRRNYEADAEDEGEAVLADWAYDCYQQGALDLLVGGDEEARSDMKMFEVFVKTAIWCIQEDPTMRPHMKRVMLMLEGSIQVPAPPDPTAFVTY